jgi:multiple sugar transport system substrate-binding protein
MSFFAQDKTAIEDMALLRGIPPTATARAIIAPSLAGNDKRASDAAAYVSDRVTKATNALAAPVAPPTGADQISELLFQSNLAIAFGKKTIKSALSSFFDQANSILSSS